MVLYIGRLTADFIRRAAENAEWLDKTGHGVGGVRFYGNRDTAFDSDNVDFDDIKASVERNDIAINRAPEGKPQPEEPKKPRGRPRNK